MKICIEKKPCRAVGLHINFALKTIVILLYYRVVTLYRPTIYGVADPHYKRARSVPLLPPLPIAYFQVKRGEPPKSVYGYRMRHKMPSFHLRYWEDELNPKLVAQIKRVLDKIALYDD